MGVYKCQLSVKNLAKCHLSVIWNSSCDGFQPIAHFAPEILQTIRSAEIKTTLLLWKVVSYVADQDNSELA